MRELVGCLWRSQQLLWVEGDVEDDRGEEEDGQPALPIIKAPGIHGPLGESRRQGGRRKAVSREFLTVYNEANVLWCFAVDKMCSERVLSQTACSPHVVGKCTVQGSGAELSHHAGDKSAIFTS